MISRIHSFNWDDRKSHIYKHFVPLSIILARCLASSSVLLNKQSNIRLEQNRWSRTIRLSVLFFLLLEIYMCCYCIILSRTRAYEPVYNMSVWCLKWTLWWRVRSSTISEILSLYFYSLLMSDTLTLALFIFIHSFIHLVTHSFNLRFQLSISGYEHVKE